MASDVLDAALDMLAPFGPEWTNGLSSHGPMAAETLLRMGRPDSVLPWTERYITHLDAAPPSAPALTAEEWPSALGTPNTYPAWLSLFRKELSETTHADVITRWTPILLPGLFGTACHGLLRAAHATRALTDHTSRQRVDELARGLAYWAAYYEELPGHPVLAGPLSINDTLRLIDALELPGHDGWLNQDVLGSLPEVKGFPFAVESLGTTTLSEITVVFAHALIACDQSGAIAMVHSVTGPACLRMFLPYLPPEKHAVAIGTGWQAAAALYFGWGGNGLATIKSDEMEPPDIDELIDRAVASADEHAIKLTEACLREHAIRPDAAYLYAAASASERLRNPL